MEDSMMRNRLLFKLKAALAGFCTLGALIVTATGFAANLAPTTQPASGELELRANQAFSRGEYAIALPLLQKVSEGLIDQPDRVGPVLERIRVCKKAIQTVQSGGGGAPPDPSIAATTQPTSASAGPPPEPSVRVPHVRPKDGETLDIFIKDLGNFEFDAEHGGNIPDDVQKLDGIKIRTHGFMIPLDQAENIGEFALVPSLFACCFGQPPQIQHTIVVHLPKGKAVSYFPDELTVEGTLKVGEKKDEGFIVSVFEMNATSVRPAQK
jgi:hypothetical protein